MNVYTKASILSIKYEIVDEFNYFIANNTGNNLPYHNLYHSLVVMSEVGDMMNITDYFRLDHQEKRNLLLAALYHDYYYLLGPITDKFRVEFTISRLPDNISHVSNLIKYTIYPYEKDIKLTSNMDKIDYMGLILREADLCQCLQDNSIHQCIFGLKREMDPENKISYYEFINKYINFIEGIRYQIVNRESDKIELLSNLKCLGDIFWDVKESN